MAPTSLLRNNDAISGVWRRTPTRKAGYLKDQITNDILAISSSTEEIGTRIYVTRNNIRYYVYFWQVSGYDSNNNIRRYGGLFIYDSDDMVTRHIQGNVASPGATGHYADFEDLFSDMTACIGILAENVIDFSISVRMPYNVGTITVDGEVLMGLIDSNNNYVYPTKNGSNNYYSYDLQNLGTTLTPASRNTSLTVSASNREIGRISLFDWNGNAIMDIPTELVASNSITINAKTVCDISGIYTIFKCGDIQMTIPEGRLPYNSNTWETYKAYQMNTDRQSMENSIRFAQFNRETQSQTGLLNAVSSGAQTGIMTGIMAGNPAGALAGIPFAILDYIGSELESDRALQLTKMQAVADFELSKRKAIEQPQTSYNAGYGFIYCILNELRPMKLALSTPKNIDSSYKTYWNDQFGYPAEGYMVVYVSTGYYQGKLVNNATGSMRGMYFDQLNAVFQSGFRFVSPT